MLHVVVVPTARAEAAAICRLLTPAELAFCRSRQRVEEHVAARLAAKQAVLTALGWPTDPRAELVEAHGLDVEVIRALGGRPGVRLGGAVEQARIARALGVPGLSLSHAAGFAAALSWLPAEGPSTGSGRVGA